MHDVREAEKLLAVLVASVDTLGLFSPNDILPICYLAPAHLDFPL